MSLLTRVWFYSNTSGYDLNFIISISYLIELNAVCYAESEVVLEVQAEEYAAKLVEFTTVGASCLATIKESKYTWADDYQFHVDMPEIIIMVCYSSLLFA